MILPKSRTLVAGALAVAGWFTAAPAAAQEIPSNYRFVEKRQEAGFFIGYQDTGQGRFGFGPEPGIVLGARYGVDLSGPFGLEGVIRYMPTTRRVIDPENSELRDVGEADALMTSAEVRIRFAFTGRRSWRGLSPHLLFGAGLALDVAGDQPDDQRVLVDDRFDFGTSLTGFLGTGVRWFATERVTVVLDGGLSLWQLETPRGYSSPDRGFEGVEEKEWASGLGFTIGTLIRF